MSGTTTPNNNNSNSNNNSNKRISEEVVGVGGGHLSKYPRDLSKYLHDDSGVGVSVGVDGSNKISGSSSVLNNEFHASSFDLASDAVGRVLKPHRPGDVVAVAGYKRSPVNVYVGLSDSDKDRGGVVGLESSKEGSNRDLKVENRDVVGKGDKDHESKDGFGDFNKGEIRVDKDVHSVGSGQLNWKESKELQNKGKRYSDVSGGNVDSRNVSRSNVHGVGELGKEGLPGLDEKVYGESHEAVGENKVVEMKGEEKMKEKDRKRKDLKHREWAERDKERSDRRTNVQLGGGSNEGKELTREERETEKWEREKKDLSKDKDKLKEREKDHFKRDAWSGGEREGSNHEKEVMDISGKAIEQDNSTIEHKKLKDPDSCKNIDREAKGAKKERDTDIEGDRLEKHIRCSEKELDDGCVEVEGATERDKEAFGYGVQQRKRMLRPRGSPQVANREPRFRSRTHENEGSEGKAEASTVIYRVGECMQELTKLWKEYESSQGEKTCVNSLSGPTLEIRVPAENVTATNRQVRGGQLWGTDIYTDDSDLVAVLMHTGYCRPTASPPPPAIQEFRAVIRVLPPQDCYVSTLRNNVRSRAWGAAIGCSYRVERCCILKRGGGTIDLEPCLTHTSTVEPTLAPVVVERTMTTRAAASNALRQQRFVREVTIQYNLCNEPWTKYSISAVADKGLKRPLYTSARLKKGEVLYLESHACRYEICFNGEKMVKATTGIIANQAETERSLTHHVHATNGERTVADGETIVVDVFRWSRCKKPLPQKLMLSTGIPLPLEHLEVMEDNLEWEDIEWSQTGVWIAGKEYPLARVHFLSPN